MDSILVLDCWTTLHLSCGVFEGVRGVVYMYFVDFEKVYNHVTQGVLSRMVHEYGHPSCYRNRVRVVSIFLEINTLPVGVVTEYRFSSCSLHRV